MDEMEVRKITKHVADQRGHPHLRDRRHRRAVAGL